MEVLKNADSIENVTELSLDEQRTMTGGDSSAWWAGALLAAGLAAGVIGAPLALAVAGVAAYELVQ